MAKLLQMVAHTKAKHLLLSRYLDRWFPILGSANGIMNYIDGFAGPGEYQQGDLGSPILALDSAKRHVANRTLGKHVKIHFYFVEQKPAYAQHLKEMIAARNYPAQFTIHVECGDFADCVKKVLDDVESRNKILAPTFAFVDPFGFSGIPFDLMRRILKHPKCEVYVNIMVEFINRFLEHEDEQIVQHFPVTFGTDDVLKISQQPGDRVQEILKLYERQLRDAATYVGKFDMHGKADQKTYSLFFASNSPLGFKKMKEANWSVDKTDGGRFSDFEPGVAGMPNMYRFDSLWYIIEGKFRDQVVPMADLDEFVNSKTDYLDSHLRTVLRDHEEINDFGVIVHPDQKRKKGQFPADKISIEFKKPKPQKKTTLF